MSTRTPERILLPWCRSCIVCGEDNPIGLRARCFKVGESVQLPFETRSEYAGWSNVMHGGFIATVLDEVMTWAAILASNKPCFAADFNVRMQETLSANTSCTAVSRLLKARRRIFDVEGSLADVEGRVYARATGRYMPVPHERAAHFRDDFITSDECLDLRHIFGRPKGEKP
jgi:acyl-coenzyme A thioesterase PaaI-like protein